jgi:hypothetical protein
MLFVQPARVPTKTALEDDTTSETNSAVLVGTLAGWTNNIRTTIKHIYCGPLLNYQPLSNRFE